MSVTRVSGFVAVHLCWNASELCEVPKFIGVIALTSKAVVILLTEQHWCSERDQGLRLCCCASLLECTELCEVPKFIGVIALTSKAVVILLHRAALVQ